MKAEAVNSIYGRQLATIDVKSDQLTNKELVVGERTREALMKCKYAKELVARMWIFMQKTADYLINKLPLDNVTLRALGCLSPTKRERKSGITYIKHPCITLTDIADDAKVVDEWKMFMHDPDLPDYDPQERIESFWTTTFMLLMETSDTHSYQQLLNLL